MKNIRILLSITAMSLLLMNACDTSSGNYLGIPCIIDSDCMGLVCVNYVCIDKCTQDSCDPGQICNNRGICVSPNAVEAESCTFISPFLNPCPEGKSCLNGVCIDNAPECSDANPCADGKSCLNGTCIDNAVPVDACSEFIPCLDAAKVCDISISKCVDRCTPESCGNDKICSSSGLCVDKCTADSCASGFICMNGCCIAACTQDSCPTGQFCGADGLCVASCTSASCAAPQICSLNTGKCIDKCTHGSCPSGQACSDLGECFVGECSAVDPCAGDKICSQGKCYAVALMTCYEDEDCGEGYGCDNKKCVDENACSLTRTCADGKMCRNGMCADPVPVACDSTHACADAEKTCIAGQCVTCGCKENETCVGDHKCIPSDTAGSYKLGDICTWSKDFQHCDNNRIITCTSEIGSDEFHVGISDCGAKICTSTSDDMGASCHDACAKEDDFYGVCLDFSGELNEFTQLCEKTDDGRLVWTLSNGYKTCTSSCTNGRCNFVPPEFGESCTDSSYPDACQGRWLTYCFHDYKMGTDCKTYSQEHFCALPGSNALKLNPMLIGSCALECTTPGQKHTECIQDDEGSVYSMTYLCAETADGKYADFEAGYVVCENGCHVESGLCL